MTGGSSGIGRATALEASKRGAKLILFGRNANALEQTAKEITTEVLTVVCDVSKKEEVEAAITKAIEHFAQIDVVINCAGQPAFGPVETLDQKTLEELFAVHVFGSLNVIQATLDTLKKQKGVIVTISSFLGYYALPYLGALGAAEAAINALTQSLRVELKDRGVAVLLYGPPQTRTPFTGDRSKGRFASAEEVAIHLIRTIEKRKRESVKGRFFKIMNFVAPKALDALFFKAMVVKKDPRKGPF